MPLRKSRSIALALAVAGLCAVAPSAASAAACAPTQTAKSFSKYGDSADYSPAPGGTFEGSNSWTLTGGAAVVAGNETVGASTGSKSLRMPYGSTATSPEFCVDETNPYFRFAMKAAHHGGYQALVLWRNSSGQVTQAQFTSSSFATFCEGKWIPSAVSPLATKITLASGTAATVQLKLVSTGNPRTSHLDHLSKASGGKIGSMLIDSVMVDPYRRG